VNFRADRTQINLGECATLLWDVENVQAVFLDGQGVVGHGSQQVCPRQTTTYTLQVILLNGQTQNYPVTINVISSATPTPTSTTPPSDTQPPAPPASLLPSGGQLVPCAQVDLRWTASSDPSGIVGYDVELEYQSGRTWVTANTWQGVKTTTVAFNPSCGLFYRWRVRAQDGAGNVGAWSAYADFGVILP
jgi:hypothetical protein